MNPEKLLKTALDKSLFAEIPDTPFSVFFGKGASIPRLYPYLKENQIYLVTDFWMNPDGDIMILLEGFNHYIKFVEGGMYICHLIKPN